MPKKREKVKEGDIVPPEFPVTYVRKKKNGGGGGEGVRLKQGGKRLSPTEVW